MLAPAPLVAGAGASGSPAAAAGLPAILAALRGAGYAPPYHTLAVHMCASLARGPGWGGTCPGGRTRSALVHGPPGTGKTAVVNVVSRLLGCTPTVATVANTSEAPELAAMFARLQEARCAGAAGPAPCVLLFDDAHALFPQSGDADASLLARTFVDCVHHLDRAAAGTDGPAAAVFVVVATNDIRGLDQGVADAMDVRIEVPLPAGPQRELILSALQQCDGSVVCAPGISTEALVEQCQGLSGADMVALWSCATSLARMRRGNAGQATPGPHGREPQALAGCSHGREAGNDAAGAAPPARARAPPAGSAGAVVLEQGDLLGALQHFRIGPTKRHGQGVASSAANGWAAVAGYTAVKGRLDHLLKLIWQV